jgi:glyoxylase-like metal-dependent hydrolase (beta-lactamase superfamily II)
MSHSIEEIAPGVACAHGKIVNFYYVGEPGGPWVLVDTGMPLGAPSIIRTTEERFGKDSRPAAIVLTHAHFDHVGSVKALAEHWDVPVYVHAMELPFVTGRADYPPFDPTVGGFFPALSRTFPEKGIDLGDRVRLLPGSGPVDIMPGWDIHHTPGHAPGHVSFFRASDGVLIVGDAFITMDTDSFRDTMTQKPEITRPPSYATCDWDAARDSVQRLASLRPKVVGTGHGRPLSGPTVADDLETLARTFHRPAHGRYVNQPARFDQNGVVSLPPAVPDPVPAIAAGVGAAALAGVAIAAVRRHQAEMDLEDEDE